MFDWIPLPYYSDIYFHVLLFIVLVVLLNSQFFTIWDKKNLSTLSIIGSFILLFILFYMGTRPISGRYFGDMATYNRLYLNYQRGYALNVDKDEIIFSNKDFFEYSKLERIKLYKKIPLLLKQVIEANNIDFTISFGDMANCFSALSKTSEIKIASIHALKSVELRQPSIMNKLFRLSYKTIYKRFNKVVCISYSIQKDLKENFKYKFDNLETIYNPHDVNAIIDKSLEPIDEPFEQELFNYNVILFLGRMSVQKAPWHLINAFYLSNIKNDYKLVFIGDGDRDVESLIHEQIEELELKEKVIFLGRKSNPYKYLKSSKILALSSLYEGTPNVIAEAIAIGIPIISSRCTDGIIEMMSVSPFTEGEIIETESGIITPNFYKGISGLPHSLEFTEEEKIYASILDKMDNNYSFYKERLLNNREVLLEKYNIDVVSKKYLDV